MVHHECDPAHRSFLNIFFKSHYILWLYLTHVFKKTAFKRLHVGSMTWSSGLKVSFIPKNTKFHFQSHLIVEGETWSYKVVLTPQKHHGMSTLKHNTIIIINSRCSLCGEAGQKVGWVIYLYHLLKFLGKQLIFNKLRGYHVLNKNGPNRLIYLNA